MSAIIWCDMHSGPFSEREAGWAYLELHVRKEDGTTQRRELHYCKACTQKALESPHLMLEGSPKEAISVDETGS